MKYVVFPLKADPEVIEFGPTSRVVVSARPPRSGRTEVVNVLCELLAGQRAVEDSRPDRRSPWKTSASVMAYLDSGELDYHALRYENGRGLEVAQGDLPDSSMFVVGYSSSDQCGWYHAGQYLSISGSHTGDWPTLVQGLGFMASVYDDSFSVVLNECLAASGLPILAGGNCVQHGKYAAEFRRDSGDYLAAYLLTRSERAGILQVSSQVIPWLLHARACVAHGAPAMESCYCLIDDLAPGVDLEATSRVMQRRFPGNRFLTLAFRGGQ